MLSPISARPFQSVVPLQVDENMVEVPVLARGSTLRLWAPCSARLTAPTRPPTPTQRPIMKQLSVALLVAFLIEPLTHGLGYRTDRANPHKISWDPVK